MDVLGTSDDAEESSLQRLTARGPGMRVQEEETKPYPSPHLSPNSKPSPLTDLDGHQHQRAELEQWGEMPLQTQWNDPKGGYVRAWKWTWRDCVNALLLSLFAVLVVGFPAFIVACWWFG
jgi:hypothetical protein